MHSSGAHVPNAGLGRARQCDSQPAGAGQTAAHDTPRVALDSEAASRSSARIRTGREVLEEYWGSRWHERQRALEEKGIDLDQPCDSPPWEEVKKEFEGLSRLSVEERDGHRKGFVNWPDHLDNAWLDANLGISRQLTPEQLALVEASVAEGNRKLEDMSDDALSRVDVALQDAWQRDRIVRSPVSTAGIRSPSPGFMSKGMAGHGWGAGVTLTHAENPELSALLTQINVLCQRRNNAVRRYIAGL